MPQKPGAARVARGAGVLWRVSPGPQRTGRRVSNSASNAWSSGVSSVLRVWARGASLASFMQYLRANLSKKVGRWVDWSGGFWERRYSAEPVLDDTALVGRLRYVLAHGVKEGWVEKCAQWPGLTCLPQLQGAARRLFHGFNWTKRWSKRGSGSREEGRGGSPSSGPSRWSWR
ncbi:hypothetical protein [Cystobacter fuscus]|uniref:hypothetical protein n=1 Tax=Cystobacter fuscus TaxID=43 RepID=UPI0037C154FF